MSIAFRHETTGRRNVFCFALCALLVALGLSAEAQQPKKVPRIGFLGAASASASPANSTHSGKGCANLVILKKRISSSNTDMRTVRLTVLLNLRLNWWV